MRSSQDPCWESIWEAVQSSRASRAAPEQRAAASVPKSPTGSHSARYAGARHRLQGEGEEGAEEQEEEHNDEAVGQAKTNP